MRLSTICVPFVCFFFLGCGSDSEALIKDTISLTDRLAAAIEKNNEAEAKQLAAQMKDIYDRGMAMKETPEKSKALQEKYMPDLMKAAMRLKAAGDQNPELMKKIQIK